MRFSETASIRMGAAVVALAGLSSSGLAQERRAAPGSGEVTTVTACVARSADYVRAATAAGDGPQLLLTDVRSGSPTFNVTGLREQDLMPFVGQRVELTGTVERARTTPVLTTAEGAVAGSVNSERPPAAGITPDGAAAHEPADALTATVAAGRVAEPARVSDPAYLVAVLPGLNATAFRRVDGTCARPPADRSPTPSAQAGTSAQRPAAPTLSQQPATAVRLETVTARGCLVRQTPGGTAVTPQRSPADILVLADAALVTPPPDQHRGAVPGSAPAAAGSGTLPATAGTSGTAPVDAATVSFRLSVPSGELTELTQHVGDRVEVIGMLEASAGDQPGSRPPAAGDGGAGPGRVQVAPVEVAHVSTPARGITVTSFRLLGGACN